MSDDEVPEPIFDAIERLSTDLGIDATVDDRTIKLLPALKGSPHVAVLQAVGFARQASPVGAAAHGNADVAAAVWRKPELFTARWTGDSRWVASYRLAPSARPDDYIKSDGGIPTRLCTGDWHAEVPDEVTEVFVSVGLLLDEAPFPVPTPPAAPPAPAAPVKKARSTSTTKRAAATPRAPRKAAAPAVHKNVPPKVRTCPGCNLQKQLNQFAPDFDLCVDCR